MELKHQPPTYQLNTNRLIPIAIDDLPSDPLM